MTAKSTGKGRGGKRNPPGGRPQNQRVTEAWRARIKAGVLLDRAMKQATTAQILDPQVESVRRAYSDMLLKKVLPDLARTEITGEGGEPLQIITRAE